MQSNLREQNPESREHLYVMRIQCDALAMYSLLTYNHTILPYEGG
jgi:hypothetical protein